MIVVLLILSIIGYVTVLVGTGALSKKLFTNIADQMYFQFIRNLISLVLMVAIFRAIFPSGLTLLLSAGMGVALLVSSAFSLIAYQKGPVGISVLVISSIAMVISALSGPVIWGEAVSKLQIVGIVLSVASMAFLTEKSFVSKTSFGWVLALILSGVGGGAQGVIQKMLAMSEYADQTYEFVTYSILFSTIAALLMLIFVEKKKDEHVSFKMDWKIFGLFLLQAGLYVFLNVNNMTLVAGLPSVVFFPAYSIGGLLLTTIASMILFKERLNKRQLIGFALGIIALLLISGTLEIL